MSKKYVELCKDEIQRETEKAFLVEGSWIPKSQLIFVINNKYYDPYEKTIKDYKEKSVMCYLVPLWLHMKNNMRYKKSDTLDRYISCWTSDMRVQESYERCKFYTFSEYQEIVGTI
ncbi:MAG: hypothetical protein II309_04160 [Bacilli bacterium]|jgi:hypothetical protein|nr:hypothetical protein [Bacilli bacterium]